MQYMTLVPAYGRDYKSRAEVRQAWIEGKDFEIASFGPDMGRYINIADAPSGCTLNIRYKKLTQIFTIKIK